MINPKRSLIFLIVVFPIAIIAIKYFTSNRLLSYTETVLTPGMIITGTNPNGTVSITAKEGTTRIFKGKGWEQKKNLIPRTERWYGSLGLYDPASSWSEYGRLLVDEGRLYFSSESEALKYLYEGSDHYKPVYTNNGLVFGYYREDFEDGHEPSGAVQLWQIYINGKRPIHMTGADDFAISVSGGQILETSTPHPAREGYPQTLGKEEYRPKKTN